MQRCYQLCPDSFCHYILVMFMQIPRFYQIVKTSLPTVAKNGNYGYHYRFAIVLRNFSSKTVSQCFYPLNSSVTKYCNKFTNLQVAKIGKCCQLLKVVKLDFEYTWLPWWWQSCHNSLYTIKRDYVVVTKNLLFWLREWTVEMWEILL